MEYEVGHIILGRVSRMGFEIRTPGPADAEACARVHIQAWKETYGHLLPADFFEGDYEERRIAGWKRMVEIAGPERAIRMAVVDLRARVTPRHGSRSGSARCRARR